MHPWLVNRVIFPLHERLKGKATHAMLQELETTQWLDPRALRELQFRQMLRHLRFAYREVPYYTRLLNEHELQPWRIASFEDFARIPFMTRELIRRHGEDLRPRTPMRGVQPLSTGGSTGSPVTVYVDPQRAAFSDATRLRAHRWFDADIGAREIVVWGSPIELTRQDRIRALRDRLVNSRLLSAFDLGEVAMASYGAAIRRYRPQKLYGYASAIHLLASYLGRQGWTAGPGWPRAIFTTAEPLYDFQRATITSVFGCPISVEYGCRDGGTVANECPAGGLHIAAEGMIVEVIDSEIVLTNLHTFAMPIIRYRTGDVGALEPAPCSCGRGLPRLRGVEGRQTDFLVTPRGKILHALAVIYVLRELPSVAEFQVIQERADALTVRIVPRGAFGPAEQSAVRSRLRRLFDSDIDVVFEVMDAIPRLASGKHRYVISAIAAEHCKAVVTAP
jgi:phenylacetate-CoA ligase